jgi:hypothetical protein
MILINCCFFAEGRGFGMSKRALDMLEGELLVFRINLHQSNLC